MEKKLLMTTMSLDIGGAETHVVELARELTRRGWRVTVASNGGVYVEALERSGVRHVKLPLHKKSALAESLSGLRRLIEEEKFDIVHAHARIPAYICGLLRRRMDFSFAVTCHGVYKVTPFWRSIAKWGDLTLSVSQDIKEYLIKNYGLFPDNIDVTINGIDTKRFFARSASPELVRELGLTGKHRVVYVSRIDRECALTAFQLVEIAPSLARRISDLEIIITGQGNAFEELRTRVASANREIGREAIKLTGMRTDVDEIIACGDIFVGVSRSCLEAMSAELPVVLSGAQGYLGIFGPEVLVPSLDTNFCCRGCGASTPAALERDITALLELSPEQRAEKGRYNREVVLREYSVARMADDAERIYGRLSARRGAQPAEILLNGYYGFGNMGDDSLLQLVIERLREAKPGVGITVLSRRPSRTAAAFGVKSINRFNLPAVAREMAEAKALIYGGGSILQTNSSSRSLTYYIHIMKMAKKRGLGLMLWGNGIGPITGERNLKKTREILAETDVITLREYSSLAGLEELGVKNSNVYVTADPAFALEPAGPDRINYIAGELGLERGGSFFAVALRRWKGACAGFEDKCAEICSYIKEKYGYEPVYIAMQPSRDLAVCNAMSQRVPGRVISGLSAAEILGLIGKMQLVISMRLHVLIYSISSAVPAIGLSYDPKIDALFDMAGLPCKADVSDLDAAEVCKMADRIIAGRAEISAELAVTARELKRRAGEDAGYALELLRRGDSGAK